MNWLSDMIINISGLLRNNLSLICLALAAVILVFVGKTIIYWSNNWINRIPAVLRFPVRSLFNIIVFGVFIFYVPNWLVIGFNNFNDLTLAPVLLLVILFTGSFSGGRS